MNQKTSDTIRNMRFPLITMVVLLHTFIIDETILGEVRVPRGMYPHFDIFEYVIKECFGEVAIPLFFVISGYLFFINVKDFGRKEYKSKLSKRVRTLLIPYICWNTLFILFVATLQMIHPEWMGDKKIVTEFTLIDWKNAYWELSQGLIPLWYVRDLMIISLFTPVIHYCIKKTGIMLPIVLGVLYLMNEFKYMPGLGTRCSFLFVLGAYFGIKKTDFLAFFGKGLPILAILYCAITVVDTLCWHNNMRIHWINQFTLIFGVMTLSGLFYNLTEKVKLHKLWAEASFFILVFHMFIIYIPGKFWALLIPVNSITIYLMQMLIPILVSFVCVGVYYVCKRITPKITGVLVGSRL